jgi:hypothetical protein
MTNETTNAVRARWAKEALAIFTAVTFSGDHPDTMERGDLECAITDLICDLMHFARYQNFDVDVIHERALTHFTIELLDEETLP